MSFKLGVQMRAGWLYVGKGELRVRDIFLTTDIISQIPTMRMWENEF